MEKLYKFAYDLQTGQYMGVTRDFLQAGHGLTDIQPHFQQGFKTIFSTENNYWHLVRDEQFFNQMSVKDKLAEQDLFCMVKITELAGLMDRFDINNADRYIALSGASRKYQEQTDNHLKMLGLEHIKFEKQMRENHDAVCLQIREQINSLNFRLMSIDVQLEMNYNLVKRSYWFPRFLNFVKRVFSRERH